MGYFSLTSVQPNQRNAPKVYQLKGLVKQLYTKNQKIGKDGAQKILKGMAKIYNLSREPDSNQAIKDLNNLLKQQAIEFKNDQMIEVAEYLIKQKLEKELSCLIKVIGLNTIYNKETGKTEFCKSRQILVLWCQAKSAAASDSRPGQGVQRFPELWWPAPSSSSNSGHCREQADQW